MTATWEDVILQSQPAFYADGTEGFSGVAGSTWMWVLESPAGQDADWSDVVFTCEIVSRSDLTTVLLELDMIADDANRLIISCAAADTVVLDTSDVVEQYAWQATAVKGDDVVTMWAPAASPFTVYPATNFEGS